MTNTDRMVVWLRETLNAAQRDAEAAGGDEWRRHEDPSDQVAVYDSKDEPVVYNEGWPTEEQQAHIVRHDPAAVLRRITADREFLDDCENIIAGWHYDETKTLAEDAIRSIAEGWGWTEETR